MVRNLFVVIMLNLYLGVLVLASIIALVANPPTSFEKSLGGNLFAVMLSITFLFTLVVICAYSLFVTSFEKINDDLMFASGITPWQIVSGKFFSGLVLSLLLFSVGIPFFTWAYCLRGLDLETLFSTVYIAFLGVQIGNAFAILIASGIKTTIQLIFTIFGVFILSSYLAPISLFFILSFTWSGSPLTIATLPVWLVCFNVTLVALSLIALFLLTATVSLSPVSSNRMFPVRVFVSVWLFLSLI